MDNYQRIVCTIAAIIGQMFMAKIYAEFAVTYIGMNQNEMKYEDKFLLAQRQMENLSLPAKI